MGFFINLHPEARGQGYRGIKAPTYWPHAEWSVPEFFEEGFNGVDFYHRPYIDTRTKPANQFPHIFGIHILTPERVRLALFWFPFVNTASFIC